MTRSREASSSDYDGASDDDSDLPALVDQMEVEEKMDQSVDDSDTPTPMEHSANENEPANPDPVVEPNLQHDYVIWL